MHVHPEEKLEENCGDDGVGAGEEQSRERDSV